MANTLSRLAEATYLIAADSGDAKRVQLAGHVGYEDGLNEAQWKSLCKDVEEKLLKLSREKRWSFHDALKKFIIVRLEEGMVGRNG